MITHLVYQRMNTQPIGTCVLLLNPEKTQVVLGRRKNGYKSGWYGAPGGHLELGESLEACAARELKEEAGITPRKLTYVGVVRDAQPEFDFIHFIFVCDEWQGELRVCEPEKCEGWKWFSIDQLPSPLLTGHALGIQLWCSGKFIEDRFSQR